MQMKQIHINTIVTAVKQLCIETNYQLPEDVKNVIATCRADEPFASAERILGRIMENTTLASEGVYPICQDTGMACVFVEIGQEVHIEGGSLEEAIHEGVRQGYEAGFLRKSVVKDPLNRQNTGDNTPAVITYTVVTGEALEITLAPKGFGSENMSRLKMLKPSDGVDGVIAFVLETVRLAGSNACPPIVLGIGIGGTFDKVASLAKKALMRTIGSTHKEVFYRDLESALLTKINELGIGPQGFGGKTTALAVHIETYPTHIAGLPIAVNLNCHVARHAKIVL
jgi:fumarate hydratase subunit alpha